MRTLFLCALLCALPASSQTLLKSIFVDSFGDKPGASDLREQVTSELRKSPGLHVVATAADADLVLNGTGEVYVKSHFSLNPRDRSIGDAQAVYTGYLSVELADKNSETVYGLYLATPHSSGSRDVSRVLARLVVKNLSGEVVDPPSVSSKDVVHMTTLTGAGATFPYPVYEKWFEAFHKRYPEIEIQYEPVGSETGMSRLMQGAVDFAGSDVMIGADEYFAGGKPKFLLLPGHYGGCRSGLQSSGHAV